MKQFFSAFLILFSGLSLCAQSIDFEVDTHDFGTVKEEDGPIVHEFRFINTGDEPVVINKVQASCGCTTPGWSKEAIAPGETGFVQAQYNTFNRPGSFYKNLTVYTDTDEQPVKLYIKGNVVPKPMTIEEELATAMGNLRMKYRVLNMDRVFATDEPTSKNFDIYNAGNENLYFSNVEQPDHIQLELPDTLKPGERKVMTVLYDAKGKGDLGFFSENVKLITNDPIDSVKSITVFANVMEYFPPMTPEQLINAPRLVMEQQVYDFDRAKTGDKIKKQFEVVNNGKQVLNIRKMDPNCSCITASLSKNDIKPGEKAVIDMIFDTNNRRGNQQKAITIYSNDPKAPVQRLLVKGYINND